MVIYNKYDEEAKKYKLYGKKEGANATDELAIFKKSDGTVIPPIDIYGGKQEEPSVEYVTIEWDGDTTGKEVYATNYYKVTSEVPSDVLMPMASRVYENGSSEYERPESSIDYVLVSGKQHTYKMDIELDDYDIIMYIVFEDEGGATKGIYFEKINTRYTSKFVYPKALTNITWDGNTSGMTSIADGMLWKVPSLEPSYFIENIDVIKRGFECISTNNDGTIALQNIASLEYFEENTEHPGRYDGNYFYVATKDTTIEVAEVEYSMPKGVYFLKESEEETFFAYLSRISFPGPSVTANVVNDGVEVAPKYKIYYNKNNKMFGGEGTTPANADIQIDVFGKKADGTEEKVIG